ncbi:hypothetical protein BT93_H3094 [Corymbia citriodora subsp. variegata]|nr:hypothetical protein BT93_H3094 [Corymbia citriodora subsp. variegata]
MAGSFGGFSIREYALKMRSEDIAKCWPFGGGGGGGGDGAIARKVAESLLPPMSVPRFRWWSRELEIARSTRDDLDAPSRGAGDAHGLVSPAPTSVEEPRGSSGEPTRSEIITFDCPVCGVLTAATVNAVNAHVDGCLARQEEKRQMKAKTKSRAPKKRSIVEIFAMSPQVQRVSGGEDSTVVEEDDEEEEEEEEERREDKSRRRAMDAVNSRKKKVKKKNNDNNTVWARVSAVGKIHKKNNKNRKKKLKKISGNGSIKKESSPKLRRKIASHLSGNVNCLCNEKKKNDMLDSASVNKEKPSLKSLSSPKKHKAMEPCKSVAKRLKPDYPVHGILKKRARSYSGQDSTVCNRQSSARVNSQAALVEKHVRFLIKDNKSGTQAKSNPQASFQQPGRHAGCTDGDHGQLIGTGGDLVQVIGAGDNLSDSIKDGTEDRAITGKGQLTDTCHHADMRNNVRPQASCPDIVNLSEECNSPSQITRVSHEHFKIYDQMKLAVDDTCQHVDYSTFREAVNGRAASCSNVSVASSAFRPENSGTELMKCFDGPGDDFSGKKPMAMTVARSSSSCFAINGSLSGRLSMSSLSTVEDAANYAVLKQPLCFLPPRNLSGNLSHLPECSERIISLTGKSMDEDFLGLPLNSHGELIQLNSSGPMPTQVKKWDKIPGSSNFLPNESLLYSRNTGDDSRLKENRIVERAREKDQLDLFPMKNFSVENSRLLLLSNQGGMESQDATRAGAFWQNSERQSSPAYLLDADINQTNIPVDACRQYDLFENQKGKGVIFFKENADYMLPTTTPVTMRLMGKDVAVGRSSKETRGSEDGKIWTDKQIIIEHHPSNNVKNSFSENNPVSHDWSTYSAPRKPKGPLHPSFDSQNAFHLRLPQKAPESLVSNPWVGWQSDVLLPDGKVSAQRSPKFEQRPLSHYPYSPSVFQLTNLPEPFMVGAETLRADSPLASRSVSHQSCQQMNRGPELKNQQILPHPKISAPTVPFLSPDFREHKQIAQQWQSPSSHKELPPWLTFSCPAPDTRECTPSQLKSFSKDLSLWRPIPNASERESVPSPRCQPFCDRGSIPHSYRTPANNFFSTPRMHYPPVTSFPYNTMASQVDSPLVVSSIACPHAPFVPVLPRSKPTSTASMSYRNRTDSGDGTRSKSFSVKIPSFGKKTKRRPAVRVDDLQKLGKPNLKLQRHGVELPISRENPSLKLDSNGERESSTVCLQDGIHKDGLMSLPGGLSYKPTEAAKPGPTKLSAGAKHILKPSKNMDRDNSMPIHSTIPFAGVTMVPESQVKSAKIYEF